MSQVSVSASLRIRIAEQARHRCGYCLRVVSLFNPRYQIWNEHFEWGEEGIKILGKSPCGRATVVALQMNNPEILVTRRLWVSVRWWPPQE